MRTQATVFQSFLSSSCTRQWYCAVAYRLYGYNLTLLRTNLIRSCSFASHSYRILELNNIQFAPYTHEASQCWKRPYSISYFNNGRRDAWDKVKFLHLPIVMRRVFDDERQSSGVFRLVFRVWVYSYMHRHKNTEWQVRVERWLPKTAKKVVLYRTLIEDDGKGR